MRTVCVVGLGYVGLPTAGILASNGFHVVGVDIDARVVETINAGGVHIQEAGLRGMVCEAVAAGTLRAALTPESADVFLIAVPTPLTAGKRADMSHVVRAAEDVADNLKPGALVILESTSPPGTCVNLLAPILERTGLTVGGDVGLAYCPERVLPGKALEELVHNDRVIGGYDRESAFRARDVYAAFVKGALHLTDATTAEMVKVLENTFRDVNIALANEAALLCEHVGIDYREVARLANHHPRVNLHRAGPGVGGHCVPVDPWFLVEQYPEASKVIRAARERNDAMPAHVVEVTLDIVRGASAPKVGVLGLAFKGNVEDIRESPSLTIIEMLRADDVAVAVHDPHVANASIGLVSMDECLTEADCLLVLTDHEAFKALEPGRAAMLMRERAVLDTRDMLDHEAWRAAGFHVRVLGSGKV